MIKTTIIDETNIEECGVIYGLLISSYGRCNKPKNAERLCREFVSLFEAYRETCAEKEKLQSDGANRKIEKEELDEIVDNVRVRLNQVVNAFAQANPPSPCDSERILNEMAKKYKIAPNLITFSSIINAYARAGQPQEAERVFRLMESEYPDIIADEVVYSTLLKGYANCNEFVNVERILREMTEEKGLQLNVVTYTTLINMYGKLKRPEEAEKVLDLMLSNGIQPNLITYNSVVNAYAQLNQPEEAERIISSYAATFIGAKKKQQTLLKTNQSLREATKESNTSTKDLMTMDIVTYNTIINAYIRNRQPLQAMSLFTRMTTIYGIAPDIYTLNSIINAFAMIGPHHQPSFCEKLLREMESTYHIQPDTISFAAVMKAYANGGELTKVEELYHQLESDASKFVLVDVKSSYIFGALLIACMRCKLSEKQSRAEYWFKYAMFHGIKVNEVFVDLVIKAIGKARTKEIFDEIELTIKKGDSNITIPHEDQCFKVDHREKVDIHSFRTIFDKIHSKN